MAKRGGMYKSEKRRKEVKRKKKQDEKLQKRLQLKAGEEPVEGEELVPQDGEAVETPATDDSTDEEKEPEGL
jgi:hypothetical protein